MLICAFIGGKMSASKGRSYTEGFILGFFLGIIGLILVWQLPRGEPSPKDGTGKKCPHCGKTVKQDTVICWSCGRTMQ